MDDPFFPGRPLFPHMKQSGSSIIAEIEELAKKPLIVKWDINLHQENFDIH